MVWKSVEHDLATAPAHTSVYQGMPKTGRKLPEARKVIGKFSHMFLREYGSDNM